MPLIISIIFHAFSSISFQTNSETIEAKMFSWPQVLQNLCPNYIIEKMYLKYEANDVINETFCVIICMKFPAKESKCTKESDLLQMMYSEAVDSTK